MFVKVYRWIVADCVGTLLLLVTALLFAASGGLVWYYHHQGEVKERANRVSLSPEEKYRFEATEVYEKYRVAFEDAFVRHDPEYAPFAKYAGEKLRQELRESIQNATKRGVKRVWRDTYDLREVDPGDAASFPGSAGRPPFIFKTCMDTRKRGLVRIGTGEPVPYPEKPDFYLVETTVVYHADLKRWLVEDETIPLGDTSCS